VRISATIGGLALAASGCAVFFAASGPKPIVQSGYDAFIQGTLGNSGANLFVSKNGRVQTINQWDLNGDGYNDVLISNDHDVYETVDAFVYWNSAKGFTSLLPDLWRQSPLAQTIFDLTERKSGVTRLPAFGGGRSIVADLNGDGYPEIVFCNYIHNYPGNRSAYVYWGGPDGYRSERKTELPTVWAAGVAAADLNGDGYPELIFANQGAEAGGEDLYPDQGLDSYIYWGSATGFDAAHPTRLPARGARDVAVADINHDGYPDIAFANHSPKASDIQVFLGGPAGYSAAHSQTIALDDPTSIRAADVNSDGYADLLVATAAKPSTIGPAGIRAGQRSEHSVYVFTGSAQGVSGDRKIELPALEARDMAVGDFNHDGFADIAIANYSDGVSSAVPSYIYWGSARGFDRQHRSELPTLGATGVVAVDLNGDTFPDLVFSNSNDGKTYDVPSYIYWGSATGFAPYLRSNIQSFGAASVTAADLNRDGRPDLVLVNQYSGDFGEIDTNIFWGNPHHYYSTASMTSLPGHGAYGTTAADLNGDGYVDLVLCNSYREGSYLYWGGPDGFSAARREALPVGATYTSSAADLNHDGYLDLVFAGMVDHKPVSYILWGGPSGYTERNRTVLPLKIRRSPTHRIADLNHDGYLDLIFVDDYYPMIHIFWGGPEGYSEAHSWTGSMAVGANLELADLNGDGYLDFVMAGMFDPVRRSYNNSTYIYWGTPAGTPSLENPVKLQSFGSVECAIADLNRDGYLDLVFSNYMSDSTRSLPLFIYWGSKDGYSNAHRTDLPAESSAGVQTLDLNGDGYPEIIIHNHLKDGHHTGSSYIYWNSPQGFDRDRRTELPTLGPHFSQRVDPGNLYTRRLEEDYISAPLELPAGAVAGVLAWKGEEPHGAKLKFQFRSAPRRESLPQAKWGGSDGPGSFYIQSGAAIQGADRADRWVQYRAVFTSPDAGAWPVITEVEIALRENSTAR
jgi:hypothetical protein